MEVSMDTKREIRIRGAKEHNLQNIDLDIPRDKFVVLTGLSGSGKSSLAFDTIYAEGQRRYMESLSSYARQFLGQMEKPDVESLEGLPPAISIDQKSTNRNPRSTVGTVTEIYDYFRLLYARIGIPHCPKCGKEIQKQSVDQMVDEIMKLPERTKIMLLAPVVRGRKGEHVKVLDKAKRSGYVRVVVDGNLYSLDEEIKLEKNKKHNIEIVVDRLSIREGIEKRMTDSIETVLKLADGLLVVDVIGGEKISFSQSFSCPDCGISVDEIEPRSFSFNNPFGACPECHGIGYRMEFDEDLIIPDKMLSIAQGAIAAPGWQSVVNPDSYSRAILDAMAEFYGFDLDTPYGEYPEDVHDLIWYGTGGQRVEVHYTGRHGHGVYNIAFEGLLGNLQKRYRETGSETTKQEYESFMQITPCHVCGGKRLKKESLAVTVGDKNIAEISEYSIIDLKKFMDELTLTDRQKQIGRLVLKEIRSRLGFLVDVGLDYLSLARATATLSGGEAQRIRLATQIGSGLVGVAYILDEPSIGLHSRDTDLLIKVLRQLQALGNTVVVVEHDEEIIRAADYIIDIGPKAGRLGGEVVYQGDVNNLRKCTDSHTVRYLTGEDQIEIPPYRRPWNNYIEVTGARKNNLKGVDVKFPLNVMTVVTGVSGSGKSSLVRDIFYEGVKRHLDDAARLTVDCSGISGDLNMIQAIEFVDQNSIGKSSRSNPVTYIGAYDEIRKLFGEQPLAKQMGYNAAYFSFNKEGGRCEECKGEGKITVEMQFMADITLECEACHGKRFKQDVLDVEYQGANIYDVLEMTVNQAIEFFEKGSGSQEKKIVKRLKPLQDVGLGYIKLGQTSSTLSGGENQRVKLAYYLGQEKQQPTLFVFDEPTTGLHFHDIKTLLKAFNALIEKGHSVVIIEHNMDVIKCADYVIDLGPEGGKAGGQLVCAGTPEEIAACEASYTGRFLKDKL